jgi:hypothetical protein
LAEIPRTPEEIAKAEMFLASLACHRMGAGFAAGLGMGSEDRPDRRTFVARRWR